MAKKEIKIPIKVDGKQILLTQKEIKKLAKETTKAASGFDAMNTSQRGADRAAKGLSRQSSNSTKNFSKMQQGISGGLVPAYATLAAQVFAVSAAFQFLQNSVNFKNLIEGQKAFGSVTGTAFGTITSAVRAATNGQLAFAEAAQATAIGTAAGLNRAQLEQLGKAARDTSLALGRDLTDSFNRLIRGVTKAEPELLDELGIILRLDPALKAYATSINKTKDELNAFERTQAVFNEVAGQAEDKFGRITEIMNPSAFALAQFATAFDDLLNILKSGVGFVAQKLLPFFTENIYALTAALSLFALPIIRTILPSFAAMETKAAENLKGLQGSLKETEKSMKSLAVSQQAMDAGDAGRAKMTTSGQSGAKTMLSKAGVTVKGDLSQRQIAAYKRSMDQKTGIYNKFNNQERIAFKAHLAKLDAVHKASTNKRKLQTQIAEQQKQVAFKKTEMVYKRAQIRMVQATALGAKAMNKAMAAAGIIGIITLIASAAVSLFNFFRVKDKEAEAAKERMDGLTDSAEKLNSELGRSLEVRAQGLLSVGQYAMQTAKMIQSASAQVMAAEFAATASSQTDRRKTIYIQKGERKEVFKDKSFRQNIKETEQSFRLLAKGSLDDLSKAYEDIANTVKEGKAPTETQLNNLKKLEGEYMGLAQSVERAAEVQKTFDQSLRGAVGPKRQFQALRSSGKALAENLDNQLIMLENDKKLAEKEKAKYDLDKYNQQKKSLTDQQTAQTTMNSTLDEILEKEDQIASKTQEQLRAKLAISPLNSAANQIARAEAGIVDKVLAARKQQLAVEVAEAQLAAAGKEEEKKDAKFNLELQKDLLATSEAQITAEAEKAALQEIQIKNAEILKKLAMESTLAGGNVALFNAAFENANKFMKGTKAYQMASIRDSADYRIQQSQANTENNKARLENQKLGADQQMVTLLNARIKQEEELGRLNEEKIRFESTMIGQTMLAAGQAGSKALESSATSGIIGVIKGEKSEKEALKETALAVANAVLESIISSLVASALSAMAITTPAITSAHAAGAGVAASAITTAFATGGAAAAGMIKTAMTLGGLPGMRYGGIISAAEGTVASGPQSGYPAILHGTEAIVPLGQGKNAIPVEFKNAMPTGATNSVVNVTINSDGSTQMDESEATQFGQAIQSAVQNEIAKQQRSGGMLDNTL
jgi:hypothetical protein